MIKSFKQFIKDKTTRHKYEPIEISFGKHSQPNHIFKHDDHKYEPIEISFGKHSQPNRDLKEVYILEEKSDHHLHNELVLEEKSDHHLHKELVKHYKLNEKNLRHVQKYTYSSHSMNKKLYKNKKLSARQEKIKRGIDSEIKAHVTPKKMIVHTGLSAKHPLWKHTHGKGKKHIRLIHAAFTSTSTNHHIARSFAHPDFEKRQSHSLKIHVPKGHHGIYVAHHSEHPNEKEFILPRNTKLKVHPVPKIKKGKYLNRNITHYTWKAHIVK